MRALKIRIAQPVLQMVALLVIALAPTLAFAKDLSNVLPAKLVSAMLTSGAWLNEFESETPETKDFSNFWNLATGTGNSEAIAQSIFSSNDPRTSFRAPSKTYSAKVFALRWLNENQGNKKITSAVDQVLSRYLELTITAIQLGSVPTYQAILQNLRSKLGKRELQLVDLSPRKRAELSQTARSFGYGHDAALVAKANSASQSSSNYLVNAVYIAQFKTIALDLQRAPAEILVTLAHEIVHAADPELDVHLRTLEFLEPKVIAKIAAITGKNNSADLASALLVDVLNELNQPAMVDIFTQTRKKRAAQIEVTLAKHNLLALSKDPELEKFFSALIGLTVENEFKAYSYSLALYSQLKSTLSLLPPSGERQRNLRDIIDRPLELAKALSASLNPFNKQSQALLALQAKGSVEVPNKELVEKANLAKALLEHHYISASNRFLNGIDSKYRPTIQLIKNDSTSDGANLLPEWTQPGKQDSPANPYQVLTAKLSTIWVYRFKESLLRLASDIAKLSDNLLTMKAGVLDLHDISLGELKLLGLTSADSTSDILPAEVQGSLREDLTSQPEKLTSYFSQTQWQPTSYADYSAIPQGELTQSLLRLRLLKGLDWMSMAFPPAQQNLVSVRVLQLKIKERFYDPNDLSDARAAELDKELAQTLGSLGSSANDLKTIQVLIDSLMSLYMVANSSNWHVVAQEFSGKIQFGLRVLETMSLGTDTDLASIQSQISSKITSFHAQVRAQYISNCKGSKNMRFLSSPYSFNLGTSSFPLTSICYQNSLYVFRQPGDYIRSATTLIQDGAPESRIFIGGRPIRLTPILKY